MATTCCNRWLMLDIDWCDTPPLTLNCGPTARSPAKTRSPTGPAAPRPPAGEGRAPALQHACGTSLGVQHRPANASRAGGHAAEARQDAASCLLAPQRLWACASVSQLQALALTLGATPFSCQADMRGSKARREHQFDFPSAAHISVVVPGRLVNSGYFHRRPSLKRDSYC
jgi:4-diphosphocytidyl-2-C-methyl-D-erythritol kinase